MGRQAIRITEARCNNRELGAAPSRLAVRSGSGICWTIYSLVIIGLFVAGRCAETRDEIADSPDSGFKIARLLIFLAC